MKISVVMPTLNSGTHIKTALDSLSSQRLKGAELIVVDSGSTDDTLDIVRSYPSDKISISLLLSTHKSPAFQRNMGMENAIGEYIAFCDSDDYMKPDMLETMLDTAIRTGSDITVCDFDMVCRGSGNNIEGFAQLSDGVLHPSGHGIVYYYYMFAAAPKPNNYVWSRVYRRQFLKDSGAHFPSTRYSEDHLFNLSLLLKNPKIAHMGKSLYCYVQHKTSLTRSQVREFNHGILFLEAFQNAAKILESVQADLAEPLLAIYAFTRVRSILFYAGQAKLSEAETSAALAVFTDDALAHRHLALCLERDYIGHYCRIHGFSPEKESVARQILHACTVKGQMPDINGVF